MSSIITPIQEIANLRHKKPPTRSIVDNRSTMTIGTGTGRYFAPANGGGCCRRTVNTSISGLPQVGSPTVSKRRAKKATIIANRTVSMIAIFSTSAGKFLFCIFRLLSQSGDLRRSPLMWRATGGWSGMAENARAHRRAARAVHATCTFAELPRRQPQPRGVVGGRLFTGAPLARPVRSQAHPTAADSLTRQAASEIFLVAGHGLSKSRCQGKGHSVCSTESLAYSGRIRPQPPSLLKRCV